MQIFVKKKRRRGFTLIELLVVIAIIGILASIVLVSLGGARTRARDARIQADISQVRTEAELFFNDNDYVYTGACADPEINILEADIDTQNGAAAAPACFDDADSYCISAVMAGGDTICASSAGQIGDDTCVDANTVCAP